MQQNTLSIRWDIIDISVIDGEKEEDTFIHTFKQRRPDQKFKLSCPRPPSPRYISVLEKDRLLGLLLLLPFYGRTWRVLFTLPGIEKRIACLIVHRLVPCDRTLYQIACNSYIHSIVTELLRSFYYRLLRSNNVS